MKINPRLEVDQVFRKADAQDQREQGRGNQHPDKEPQKKEESATHQVTDAEINDAINSIAQDPDFVSQGLHIEERSERPGLRLALVDKNGKRIRDMSGEEFVRLRDSVQSGGSKSGKILDKKA